MKLNQMYGQIRSDHHDSEYSLFPVPTNRTLLLLPMLLYQFDFGLLTGILVAVIIGIIFLFILIALILLPLSRRAARRQQTPNQADIETGPMERIVPAEEVSTEEAEEDEETVIITTSSEEEEDETVIITDSSLTTDESGIATILSLPSVLTVGEPSTLPVSGQRPAKISWQISALTDVGLRRELNEDNMLMIEGEMDGLGPYGIYIVADGLGGHEAGEVASQLTVSAIQKQHTENPPVASAAPFEDWLKSAVLKANEVVIEHQGGMSEASKMGSTLVMALVTGTRAHIVNVGDSRAYRLNREKIEQISVDHSLVERLVQIGQITREEARTHKQRNVIYSIIGEKRKLEIGFYHVALEAGERLLLCSDGLSGMVSDEHLLKISLSQTNLRQANQLMVEAAKQAGGHDNITAVMVQMNGGE